MLKGKCIWFLFKYHVLRCLHAAFPNQVWKRILHREKRNILAKLYTNQVRRVLEELTSTVSSDVSRLRRLVLSLHQEKPIQAIQICYNREESTGEEEEEECQLSYVGV